MQNRLNGLFHTGKTTSNGRFIRNLFERCVELQAQPLANIAEAANADLNALEDLGERASLHGQ